MGVARRVLIVNGLWTMLVIGLASAILGPSLPALAQTYALSWGEAGRVFVAQFGGKLLAVLLVWAMGQRWAAKGIATVGGVLLAVGLLLVGVIPSFGAVLGAIFVFGLGHGWVDVGFNSLLTQALQPEPGASGTTASGLNFVHLFFGMGALSGPMIVSVLQRRTGHWQGAFLLAAFCAMLIPLGLWMIRGAYLGRQPTSDAADTVCMGRVVLIAMAICFLYGGLETAIGGWLYTFLIERADFEMQVATAGVTLYWGLLTGGRLLSAWGVRRLGDLNWLLALGGVLCMAMVIGLMAGSQPGALVLAVTGLGLSGIFPTMVGWVTSGAGGSAATTAIAKLVASSSLGAVMVPWMVGIWVDWRGIASAFFLLLMLALLLEGLFLLTQGADSK